jgi:hypothetical protein
MILAFQARQRDRLDEGAPGEENEKKQWWRENHWNPIYFHLSERFCQNVKYLSAFYLPCAS